MDSFYASMEEREHPEFKGKPVVVGSDPKEGKGRGVVSTSNYEARKFGIHSAMPISTAFRLCPDAFYVRPDFKLYIETSSRIMKILRKYAEKFEQWGLDEAFFDVSSKIKDFEAAKILAQKIKKEIHKSENLTCSIGVGPNKLIAKIASDYKKPDGLTVVKKNEAKSFLSPMSVRKLLWVGKKTEARLNKMGIKTIGDLAAFDLQRLVNRFGVAGIQYYQFAHGIDHSQIGKRGKTKSIGRETTFETNTDDQDIINFTLNKLAKSIQKTVSNRKLLFKTITIKVRYENFETHIHAKKLAS